jgi:two-component system response regulator HydG
VEDDTSFGVMLESWFKKNDFEPTLCSGKDAAKKAISKHKFNVILSDLRLPDGDGIMLLSWMREQKNCTPLIIMTSYAEVQSAVSAIKLGAADFLEKPINPSLLKQKIEQILGNSVLEGKPETAIKPEKRNRRIVQGKSPSVVEMYEHIRLVSPTQMSVLILGESGTGKEYIARQIHESSSRGNAPFIALDCGSLSKDLAPSELFGHLKGSFTSAIADKKGAFEQANTGTIFLDEVGNLPYDVQVQLLRVLQERKIRSVGSATDISVDVRILAATNENLETAIAEGRFREDLYHRLNEFSISVPPLRERVEDISTFVEHFLEEANQELDTSVESITKETLSILEKYSWSGNLRELRNVIRRATLFAQKNKILPEHLPILTPSKKVTESSNMALRNENEQEQIEEALKKTRGNKTLAAQLLQIDRKTLYNKMHLYNIKL